jgi:hypothetical protein
MPSEFLRRIAGIQGQGLLSKTIAAKGEEIVNQKIGQTTDIVNRAANEMALLTGSADMKTIDQRIDELSKRPDVLEGTADIKKVAEQMNLLSTEVAKKEKKYNKVYNKAIMSLGAIGGDNATRVMNMVARDQGLTNKALDEKIDAIDLQVKRQNAYTSTVINTKQLAQIEEDEDYARKINIGREHLLADTTYQSLTDMAFDKTSKEDLELFETNKTQIIDTAYAKLKDQGITRDMLEKSFAKANLYTGKFQQNKGPSTPDEVVAYKESLNYLKTATALAEQAGGWEQIEKILKTPDDYTGIAGEKGNLYKNIIGIFGNDGQGGASMYDRHSENVRALNPKFGKTKNMQQNLRQQALDKGAVVPPLYDVPIDVPEDETFADVYMFNGSTGIGDLSYNPQAVNAAKSKFDAMIEDPTTFSRPEGGENEQAFLNRGGLPPTAGYFFGADKTPRSDEALRGFRAPRPEDFSNWQKLSNSMRALKVGGITPDEQGDFARLTQEIKEEYAGRLDPSGKPMPYIEPIAKVESNVDYLGGGVNKAGQALRKIEPLIVRFASQHDVSQDLVRSVMFRESKGVHRAVSDTGVKGLMQISKITLEELSSKTKKYGLPDYYTKESIRSNPEHQVNAGVAYLSYLSDEMGGKTPADTLYNTLLAYNGGMKAAKALRDENYAFPITAEDALAFSKKHNLKANNKYFNLEKYRELQKYPGAVLGDYQEAFGLKVKGR